MNNNIRHRRLNFTELKTYPVSDLDLPLLCDTKTSNMETECDAEKQWYERDVVVNIISATYNCQDPRNRTGNRARGDLLTNNKTIR
jgi:hypothetical protein